MVLHFNERGLTYIVIISKPNGTKTGRCLDRNTQKKTNKLEYSVRNTGKITET